MKSHRTIAVICVTCILVAGTIFFTKDFFTKIPVIKNGNVIPNTGLNIEKESSIPENYTPGTPVEDTPIAKPSPVTKNTPVLPSPQTATKIVRSCNQKAFTMGLIFIASEINTPDITRYKEELSYIKTRLPKAFSFATDGYASLSIPKEPIIFKSENLLPGGIIDLQATLKKFYETAPDAFDFVTIFTNAGKPQGDYYHVVVQNTTNGIGLEKIDMTTNYGSKGQLLGINYMNDMLDRTGEVKDCYKESSSNSDTLSTASFCGMGGILHETAHQWGVYTGNIVSDSSPTGSVPIRNNSNHYYYGLSAPEGTQDLLASVFWKKMANGSYVDDVRDTYLLKYHPFTLYFMGLLPQGDYTKKFTVMQHQGEYQTSIGPITSMSSIYKQVSVEDIISQAGPRKCF